MPRVKSANPLLSSNPARVSPYNRKLSKNNCRNCKNVVEISEGEGTRCCICMEHLNTAVLLICSSHEKGCRPHVCDTSHRSSNCFDQVCKMYGLTPSKSSSTDHPNGFVVPWTRDDQSATLACPLCWGKVSGWIVVEEGGHCPSYMVDSRLQSPALQSC